MSRMSPGTDQPAAPVAGADAAVAAAGATVVKRSRRDGGGEDEEIFVFGDDDDDLPAAQVAVAGATAEPCQGTNPTSKIGKVPLLNAEQEVELAKRIEAGLFAEEKLAERENLPRTRVSTWSVIAEGRQPGQEPPAGGQPPPRGFPAKRYTGRGMLFLDLIRRGTWA